ncbi:Serine/threonine-protein kinase PknB [Phycisphaerae bacterium RAS1]|nr:Serine/threonine-protein kinase PknB [Phycisphaerae bacterium RAS1]
MTRAGDESYPERTTTAASDRGVRVAAALDEYWESIRSGREIDEVQFLATHSDLAAELRVQIAVIRAMDALGGNEPRSALPPDAGHHSNPTIPGYKLGAEIHRGGQGVVYEAVQASTGRRVAVKVCHARSSSRDDELARFRREVEVLAGLCHPNIVTIHDYGAVEDCHYYAMEFIAGEPLDRWCDRWRSMGSPRELGDSIAARVAVFAKVGDAVHAAHLRGVIHRDLKPGNVRVSESGEPYVLDFGLAKLFAVEEDAAELTQTGQFIGSVPWSAPEQVDGGAARVDLRTDVYALGVMLYRGLTGRHPYDVSGSIRRVFEQIVSVEPLRPSALVPAIRGDLDVIVLKCLRKPPAERYQSADDLSRDLRHYLAGEPIEARRGSLAYLFRRRLWQRRVELAIATLAMLVVGMVCGWYWSARRAAIAAELKEEANLLGAGRLVTPRETFFWRDPFLSRPTPKR